MYYYKFHISDWLVATSHLTLEEEAVYFRLLNFYYDSEQPIPIETQSVIRRLRLGSSSDTVSLILAEFFNLREDGWHHNRCDTEIAEYHSKAEINQKNGAKGGRPRVKTQSVIPGNPNETLTTNHKPITTNQDKPIRAKKATQIPETYIAQEQHHDLAKELGVNILAEIPKFVDYHKAKGSTMKDWDAALRTWIRNSARFSKPTAAAGKSKAQWEGFDSVDYGETGAIK